MSEYTFKTFPNCSGHGVRDNGNNCRTCGGTGTGGLRSQNGIIGSGDIIIETATGRIVPRSEFRRKMMAKYAREASHD